MSQRFLRVAATCWMVSSVTTLCLIFLPRLVPEAPDLESQAELFQDPAYRTRVWVALFHPLIVLVGALGILMARFPRSPGAASCGFLFFLLWAGTEAIQQSLVLVALNWTWRAAYSSNRDFALESHIRAFEGVSDALFFFLLIAFILANLCFSLAVWDRGKLTRTISIFFMLAAGLGLVSLLTSFGRGVLPESVMAVAYPTIQPAGRFLTGVWLWRTAQEAQ
jgi:hypothetical protein